MAFMSKGAGVGSYGGLEYMLWMFSGDLRLTIGNGAGSFTHVISSTASRRGAVVFADRLV